MLRAFASVIVGYIVMAAIVMISLTAIYLALGTDRSFEPGSWTPSTLWIAIMLIVGIIAALAGGWSCKAIAKSAKPPRALAGIVLVLGILMAGMTLGKAAPAEPRGSEVSNLDAMNKAVTPSWVNFANALIGFAGVLVGAGFGKERAGGAKQTP
ncbi:MAG: hypothetical protein IT432_11540 [Phycisphaerales bacterium]|nr:hypothetical protein [Phycisphaerales bacterium]